MIASLHDENNHITIPGFYDNVEELSTKEREAIKTPFSLENYKSSDIDEVYGKKDILPMKEIPFDQHLM